MSKFVREAMDAGFTKEQAEFMEARLAVLGHSHEIEDVNGLDEALGDPEDEGDEEEDEEDT